MALRSNVRLIVCTCNVRGQSRPRPEANPSPYKVCLLPNRAGSSTHCLGSAFASRGTAITSTSPVEVFDLAKANLNGLRLDLECAISQQSFVIRRVERSPLGAHLPPGAPNKASALPPRAGAYSFPHHLFAGDFLSAAVPVAPHQISTRERTARGRCIFRRPIGSSKRRRPGPGDRPALVIGRFPLDDFALPRCRKILKGPPRQSAITLRGPLVREGAPEL